MASGACIGGGSDLTLAAPFALDLADPVDLRMSSKNVVFIVTVVILGLDGALALYCFDFCHTASCESPAFGTQITNSSRTESRKFARFRAGDGSAQNFAANLMGQVKSFLRILHPKNQITHKQRVFEKLFAPQRAAPGSQSIKNPENWTPGKTSVVFQICLHPEGGPPARNPFKTRLLG